MKKHDAMLAAFLSLVVGLPAFAQSPAETSEQENWSLHGQATFVEQYHPAFKSAYLGPNSMDPESTGRETVDLTLYAGLRLWQGGEVYANPEIDQGFGLSNTLGAAGFPSGEAYKVGKSSPYFRLQRLFFRQTFNLGGDLGGGIENVEAGPNQLGGARTVNNLVLTGGKISPTDMFDTNAYAHDPKSDFLNWSLIDAGAFDYAADAWGYSYGIAGEWTQDWWTLRAGLFNLSRIPNTTELERDFNQFEVVAEAEGRHTILGKPGKIKLLGFLNRGRMGSYADAVRLAQARGTLPDMVPVRRTASRPGGALNIEQQLSDDIGGFARFSLNDGSKEAYEFTEINRSLALGLSVKGAVWGRPDDMWGVAGVVNALSNPAKTYFAAGGMGILIGDGQLRRYGTENIVETYYSFAATDRFRISADYQLIVNPAYSRDRGPISVLGFRLHGEF